MTNPAAEYLNRKAWKNKSLADIATALGTSRGLISYVRSSKKAFSAELLYNISQTYKVDFQKLFELQMLWKRGVK